MNKAKWRTADEVERNIVLEQVDILSSFDMMVGRRPIFIWTFEFYHFRTILVWRTAQQEIYLINVLIFFVWMSYIFFTASFIFFLSALRSTMKTRVLLSSIFFIADSVVRGYLRMAYWSSLFLPGALTRGYLGFLSFFKVLGRWNVTFVLIFCDFFLEVDPDLTALAALTAWALGSVFLVESPAIKD